MTVDELKEMLDDIEGDRIVIIAKDGEGNAHSPLSGGWEGYYLPDSTWSGDCYEDEGDLRDNELHPEDPNLKMALVLTPTN